MNWLKTFVFTLVAPGGFLVLIPWLILRGNPNLLPDSLGLPQWIGIAAFLIGFSVYLWTASDFVRVGIGTPAPIYPTRHLVATGLYRYVRNPMYLGVLTALAGEVCFFQSLWLLLYFCIGLLAINLFVIFYEEPTLQKSFGAAYTKYRQHVPRWMPRFKPYRRDAGEY